MKKQKNKMIAGVIAVIVLVFAFWYGGDAPGLRGWKTPNSETGSGEVQTSSETLNAQPPDDAQAIPETEGEKEESFQKETDDSEGAENKPQKPDGTPMTASEKLALADQMTEGKSAGKESGNKTYSEANGMEIDASTGKDKYQTDPVPEGKPVPVEPENAVISDQQRTCTLSVRCDTILKNMAWLDQEKAELVPSDGVLFAQQQVIFYEGESVFHLLLREMKKNKIHLEFTNTPIYHSAYIEGIGNLYEFDCGELSGWMYKVNGWFPNYGCSRYQLKEGDRVEWVYTCDLGADVGGKDSTRNGR